MPDSEKTEPRSARARALVEYLTISADYPFGRVEAVQQVEGFDLVDVVVEPELVQRRKVKIIDQEPIRIGFPVNGDEPPKLYARRAEFPGDLVHTNDERSIHGCSLCIWEENWDDLKRTLTAQSLFERIRSWLSKTADGTIHQEEQALEPMIPATAWTAVLPPGPPPSDLFVSELHEDARKRITLCLDRASSPTAMAIPFAIFHLVLPSQVHGALRNYPGTLAELQSLVGTMGVNFIDALGTWIVRPEQLSGADRRVLLLITLPKKATKTTEVTEWDTWGFQPTEELFALGERLGRTAPDATTGQPRLLITPGETRSLDEAVLINWRIVRRLDRATARSYSAATVMADVALVGIGAGAIGSNLMANAMRAGIGPWAIIDDDINLPHNVVRQAQLDAMVGHSKALSSAGLLNAILAETGSHGINANFLSPRESQASEIGEALERAGLAIDFSASPAVLGALADDDRVARAASFFFNPDACDLVILCEDKDRAIRLDEIEAQYFIAAATSALLQDHLDGSRADFVRYANACQDLTRPVPPWRVQTLCGVGAGHLQHILGEGAASAGIWRLDSGSAAIIPMRLPLSKVHRHDLSRFRVTMSADVVKRMRALRLKDAPNETGGILLGSFDLQRKVIHVVNALPAPADSRQAPTYFVRGKQHLKPIVDGIGGRSAGAITYLGEWHSHPDRANVGPSDDDEDVFSYLKTHLDPSGSPYLMVICGKKEVWLRAGWNGGAPGEGTIVN